MSWQAQNAFFSAVMRLASYTALFVWVGGDKRPGISTLYHACSSFREFSGCHYTLQYSSVIRKCGSTSYVGMWQVQNGILCLRYRSHFAITEAKHCKECTHKNPALCYCRKCPGFPLNYFKVAKIVCKNVWFVLLLFSFFLSFFLACLLSFSLCIKQKIQGIHQRSAYAMNTVLLEIFFWFRAVYELHV